MKYNKAMVFSSRNWFIGFIHLVFVYKSHPLFIIWFLVWVSLNCFFGRLKSFKVFIISLLLFTNLTIVFYWIIFIEVFQSIKFSFLKKEHSALLFLNSYFIILLNTYFNHEISIIRGIYKFKQRTTDGILRLI